MTSYALDKVKLVRLTPDAAVLTNRAKVGTGSDRATVWCRG